MNKVNKTDDTPGIWMISRKDKGLQPQKERMLKQWYRMTNKSHAEQALAPPAISDNNRLESDRAILTFFKPESSIPFNGFTSPNHPNPEVPNQTHVS